MLSCPAWSDLFGHGDASHLDLQAKDVAGSVKYDKVVALAERNPDLLAHLHTALRWVLDADFLCARPLPHFRRYVPRLSDKDILLLDSVKKFCKVFKPRCSVKAFSVPEWAKKRRRPIFWPDINECISVAELQPSRLPQRADVRAAVASYKFMLQFDFMSFYDQLPLAESVRPLFSFQGRTCLANLPMGFRPAVEVAQAISLVLADLQLPGVRTIVYIDNILLLCDDPVALRAAGDLFVQRATSCGAVFNAYTLDPVQSETFLGESYDLVAGTRTNSAKTLSKVTFVSENLAMMRTFTDVASLFGLLFFASEVANLHLAFYFEALQYYRHAMSLVAKDEDWSGTAPAMSAVAYDKVTKWLGDVRTAAPTPIVAPITAPTLTIYCDASAHGWGAVSLSQNAVLHLSGVWSDHDKINNNIGSSLVAEPLGIWRAVSAVVTRNTPCVRIFTDHKNLTNGKNYARNVDYNNLYKKLAETYPDVSFIFSFIPGKENTIADLLSRGEPLE